MTLKKAFGLATQGPLVVQQHDAELVSIEYRDNDGGGSVADCGNRPVDATLLAHCFNHFQDVVDALKKQHRALINPKSRPLTLGELQDLIDKVEDVEGVEQ